jgi:hypothetical protein
MLSAVVLFLGLVPGPAVMAQGEALVEAPVALPGVWGALSREQKVKMITSAITEFQTNKGVTIRKEPGFYVDQIDAVYLKDPVLDDKAIGSIFRMLAISYRDFDNGQDPEELIRAELGDEKYQKSFQNKELFEQIYQEYLRKKKNPEGKK